MLLIFVLFCVEIFGLFVFVSVVCPMFPMSLDCSFLIIPSGFSNLYFKIAVKWLWYCLQPMLPGTLNCPSMIAPSDLCNYYLVLMSQCALLTEIKVKPSPPFFYVAYHAHNSKTCMQYSRNSNNIWGYDTSHIYNTVTY